MVTEIEQAIGALDRGQRERLRGIFASLNQATEFGEVFAGLMDAVDTADAQEQYLGFHVNREVWLAADEEANRGH